METIFVNTENSKSNEPRRFRLSLADKFNLKNSNKNTTLVDLSIYYTFKYLLQHTKTINLKFLLQLGMISSICLMVLILLLIFKATLNLSSKNMKL